MKHLIYFFLFLLASCSRPQSVDCDHMKSKCTIVLNGFSDCTPADGKWDSIHSDTIVTIMVGCPDEIESNFADQQVQFQTTGSEQSRKFSIEHPSTCNCQ